MKIALCGGHLTPALAVLDYIREQQPQDAVIFIGRHYSQDLNKQLSHEAAEVEQRAVPFVAYQAPRLNSTSIWQQLTLPIRMIGAIARGVVILLRHRPDVFLSFGGYLALPLTVSCNVLRIPVVTHEQTRAVGVANQIIGRLAKKIALTDKSSAKFFPQAKVVVTGNPLRTQLFKPQPKPNWVTSTTTKPILYITGGNQGSEILNTVTQQSLRSLAAQWLVIHQCGSPTQRRNYRQELEQARKQLPGTQQSQYVIKEWISEAELGWIYQHAQVVISRAGANTVSELIAHRLPAVLVPLPFSHHDEQLLNAAHMKELGGAEIILQKDLTSTQLLKTLQVVKKYQKTMRQQLAQVKPNLSASAKIYDLLTAVTQ